MKRKYEVLKETGYDITNGHSSYGVVKAFKNERDAFAFYSDPKNLRMHGELFLERHDPDGKHYEWDGGKQEWRNVS